MSETINLNDIKILSEEDVKDARIANLPNRPNQPSLYGRQGLTATEMKAKYDEFPDLVRKRLNKLIEWIHGEFDPEKDPSFDVVIGTTPILKKLYVQIGDTIDTIVPLETAIVEPNKLVKWIHEEFDPVKDTQSDKVIDTTPILKKLYVRIDETSFESLDYVIDTVRANAEHASTEAINALNNSVDAARDAYLAKEAANSAEKTANQALSFSESASLDASIARKEAEYAENIVDGFKTIINDYGERIAELEANQIPDGDEVSY